MDSMDRLSHLPQHILHQMLTFLTQREAFQTCVLSKSWLYLGSTRPKIEFRERYFPGNNETFLSVLEKTFQRYHDRNLSIQEFILEMSEVGSESIIFLEKWIPIVIMNMGVTTFDLSFRQLESSYFDLPSIVFKAEMLQKLCLERCKLNNNSMDDVLFKHLTRLTLKDVYIVDETLAKIMSSCPLIEYLILRSCEGLRTIEVNKTHDLKLFDSGEYTGDEIEISPRIDIDVPSLITIKIGDCPNWVDHHNKYFPLLQSLHLNDVRLSKKFFDSFSSNFPCLEELKLGFCYGFEEFQLLSRSIKHLKIEGLETSTKTAIDVPNIVTFHYAGEIPCSILFKTISFEWKSTIVVWSDVALNHDAPSWWLNLYELLDSLNESEISLDINQEVEEDDYEEPYLEVPESYGGFHEPVDVEHLQLTLVGHSSSSSSNFINNLFRICRPRNISKFWYLGSESDIGEEWEQNKLSVFLWKSFREREKRNYFWQQDLEDASIEEVFDNEDRNELLFRLKWA